MAKWSKEEALRELHRLRVATEELKSQRRYSADHTRWLVNCLELLEDVFGHDSRYYMTFAKLEWQRTGTVLVGGPGDPWGSRNPAAALEREHQEAYVATLDSASGLLQAASDLLEQSELAEVYQGKDTPPESSAIVRIINLCDRQLRKVIRDKPRKEKEVQDGLENLLIGATVEYARESDHIEFSSKTYVPDFTFSKIDLALEVKLCGSNEREKAMIGEISDDILAYQTKYGNLLFVIYDNGFIRDTDRFKRDFERSENVIIVVVKH
ncbi:MAG: hypothetical protein ABII79_01405 [bacterium]